MKTLCPWLWLAGCGILTSLAFASLPTAAAAATSEAKRVEAAPGWTLGPFILEPELTLGGAYDSNIYATRDAEVDDRSMMLTPSLAIKSDGLRHRLRLHAGAQLTRFDKHHSEDSDDYWLNANGRYDLGKQSNLFGGFAFSQEHEDRGSPEDLDGREPTNYFSSGLHLGTEFKTDKFGFRLGGSLQDLDFDDVPSLTTAINNDDRDRSLYGIGLRASYQLNDKHSPFIQLIYEQRNYVQTRDDNNFTRDSSGYRAALGLKSQLAQLSSEIYLGSLWQEYDDARFQTMRELDLGASLAWKPRPGTKVVLVLERELVETTLASASGYLETAGLLNLAQRLTRRLSFSGQIRLAQDEYQGIKRKDDILDLGVGLKYALPGQLYLAADYRFIQQDSKPDTASVLSDNDYDRQQIFLTLGLKI